MMVLVFRNLVIILKYLNLSHNSFSLVFTNKNLVERIFFKQTNELINVRSKYIG